MPRRRESNVRSEEARRLRRIRDELELTQRELATLFGVASGAIAQWESGQHTVPGPVLRLIELYEAEMGLTPDAAEDLAPAGLPATWGGRTPRSTAAAVLWLLFFGTLRDGESHPLLRQVRHAALRRSTQLVGGLKGLAMKLEQMTGFADLVLPETERKLLASLRVRAVPMSRAEVCQVFVQDFGKTPRQLFAEWNPEPFATASIGQVHQARLADGRAVAVKVQYPRIAEALKVDLDQAALLQRVLSLFLRGQNNNGMMDELRERMLEECDYLLEASRQRMFAGLFPEHDAITVPAVIDELSQRHVLTSELVHGSGFDTFASTAAPEVRNHAAHALLDFYIGTVLGRGLFNTDPHPGNFLFDGTRVFFVDFGRVKQFSPRFTEQIKTLLRALFERDRAQVRATVIAMGVVPHPDRFNFEHLFRGLLLIYRPYLRDAPFTFTIDHMRRIWKAFVRDNPNMTRTNFTAELVFLNQFHFGVTALLAKLGATVTRRGEMLDALYGPGAERPPAFSEHEIALLD